MAGAALLDENDGETGVLAEGDAVFAGDLGVLEELVDEFDGGGMGFGLASALESCNHLVVEIITGLYAELTDGVNYRLIGDIAHCKGFIRSYLRYGRLFFCG